MARATGYEPLGVLKPFGRDIWTVDGPVIRFYGMPFPTRMTVVRLADGGLWLHSPIAFSKALLAEVETLGPIRHLIAPNWIHYASVYQWQEFCPDATTWAAPGVRGRAETHGVPIRIDHVLTNDCAPPWAHQIALRHVTGSKVHSEVVFFHHTSATLILTDLIENFDTRHLPLLMAIVVALAGMRTPDGRMPPDMARTFRAHRGELRGHVEWMLAQAPERVILAHGRCYETDAPARLRRAFAWALNG